MCSHPVCNHPFPLRSTRGVHGAPATRRPGRAPRRAPPPPQRLPPAELSNARQAYAGGYNLNPNLGLGIANCRLEIGRLGTVLMMLLDASHRCRPAYLCLRPDSRGCARQFGRGQYCGEDEELLRECDGDT